MATKEEIAQRLLNRCELIEESRKKIDEAVQSSMPDSDENISESSYRRQIEQCRRALISSQENAKLKHARYENTISKLRKEIEKLRADVRDMRDLERRSNSDTASLKRDLKNTRDWAEKASKHVADVNDENTRLKNMIRILKNTAPNNNGPNADVATASTENNSIGGASVGGGIAMEKNLEKDFENAMVNNKTKPMSGPLPQSAPLRKNREAANNRTTQNQNRSKRTFKEWMATFRRDREFMNQNGAFENNPDTLPENRAARAIKNWKIQIATSMKNRQANMIEDGRSEHKTENGDSGISTPNGAPEKKSALNQSVVNDSLTSQSPQPSPTIAKIPPTRSPAANITAEQSVNDSTISITPTKIENHVDIKGSDKHKPIPIPSKTGDDSFTKVTENEESMKTPAITENDESPIITEDDGSKSKSIGKQDKDKSTEKMDTQHVIDAPVEKDGVKPLTSPDNDNKTHKESSAPSESTEIMEDKVKDDTASIEDDEKDNTSPTDNGVTKEQIVANTMEEVPAPASASASAPAPSSAPTPSSAPSPMKNEEVSEKPVEEISALTENSDNSQPPSNKDIVSSLANDIDESTTENINILPPPTETGLKTQAVESEKTIVDMNVVTPPPTKEKLLNNESPAGHTTTTADETISIDSGEMSS